MKFVVALLFSVLAIAVTESLYLGLGGTPGNRTPRTGSSWPPYPNAGLGYWAAKAGFYGNRVRRSADPLYLKCSKGA